MVCVYKYSEVFNLCAPFPSVEPSINRIFALK
nr:MAG TPA_asm: hypothetical protein [Caudoviricetes sp.]